ncbi:DNA polymerase III subunit delta [Propionibacteriaceae bacterium G1746]|uniref:DNA polymerase III subunit delta n=1 Tax=Aestuariimicrobium sp. G57 TaxID=3418485 RepID=UPI003C15A483
MSNQVLGTALLVQGPESLLAERAVQARIAAARRDDPQVEVNTVDAATLDAGSFTELTGGSLFATSSVVVLEDVSNLDQGLFDLVAATAQNPPETLALVLVHPGGVKGKGLVDKLKKAKVTIVEAAAIKAWKLPDFVKGEAKRAGLAFEQGAVEALVEAVGEDARALAAAVDQLAADLPEPRATTPLIHRYFAGRNTISSFNVADDIMAGRTGEALLKLRWALDTGVAPVLLTSAIANSLRGLGRYHDLRGSRLPEAELARQIGVPPFKIKQIAQQSRAWSPAAIAAGIRAAAIADAAVKGAQHDPEYALEQLLGRLAAARASG